MTDPALNAFVSISASEAEKLSAVYERTADECCDALLLDFKTKRLVFEADPDNDTIAVRLEDMQPTRSGYRTVSERAPWKELLGTALAWGWVMINQQGYCDGVLLSFDLFEPSVLLNVSASAIKVCRVQPAGETPGAGKKQREVHRASMASKHAQTERSKDEPAPTPGTPIPTITDAGPQTSSR